MNKITIYTHSHLPLTLTTQIQLCAMRNTIYSLDFYLASMKQMGSDINSLFPNLKQASISNQMLEGKRQRIKMDQ